MFIQFFAPFLFLSAVPVLARYGDMTALVLPPVLIVLLLVGERIPLDRSGDTPFQGRFAYRALPWLYIPCQIGVIVWGAVMAASGQSMVATIVLALMIGTCCGIFGVLAAHEMVHSRRRGERALGQVMLTFMAYRHFCIAHIYGHHRFAATPLDAATARKSESVYAFLVRAVWGQLVFAYDFETRRLAGRRFAWFAHRLHQDAILQGLLYGSLLLFAPRAALFLMIQSVTAILVLELFNYVAHYGLERRIRPDGRREATAAHHSWNTRGTLANSLIFNMGRHSDHHAQPTAPYQMLSPQAGPELPGGYAGAIFLAFMPPLWRRVMDPKVDYWMGQQGFRADSRV